MEKTKIKCKKEKKCKKRKKEKKEKKIKKINKKKEKKSKKIKKNKKENKQIPQKPQKNAKNENINLLKERFNNLKNCIKNSYIFFITLLICNFILIPHSNNILTLFFNFFMSFLSLSFAILLSYHIHIFSHSYDFYDVYKKELSNLKLSNTEEFILFPLIKFFKYFALYGDFHDKIHHNSDINRKWYYLIIEFIENFINSGGILIFFLYFSNFKLFFIDKIYSFNYNSIILWALFYATYHLINYEFKNEGHSHNIHHKFVNLNYGYDFMDIIYGTKYDMNNLDNMNDGSLNLIIITLLLIIPKIYNYYKNI